MIRPIFLTMLFLLFCLSSAVQSEEQLADRIVAVVNEDVILQSDVQARINEVRARYQGNPQVLPADEVLREQILDTLIMEQVQLQQAESRGIAITDAELNQAMTQVAERQGLSLTEFRDQASRQGLDYASIRRQVRQNLLIQRAQRRFVAQELQVTRAEVDRFLQTQISESLTQPELQVHHVLIPATEADARAQAQAIADAVNRNGQTLREAAGQRRMQDLGWREPEDLPELVREPVKALTVEQASAPFQSNSGWHVIYLADQRGDRPRPVTEYQVRHILISNSSDLTAANAEALLTELARSLRDGDADFAELARNYSDDSSAQNGGRLGWNPAGVFVPAFAEAVRTTPKGAVSDPIRTTFGWHIIEVLDERERDQAPEQLRSEVRNILLEQKYAEALPRWQQEIRNSAYIYMPGESS